MKTAYKISLAIIGFVFTACNAPKTDEKEIGDTIVLTKPADSFYVAVIPDSVPVKMDSTEAEVIIKNKSDYSEKFVGGLRKQQGYQKFQLIDSLIIMNGKDTATFPQIPEIGKYYKLTCGKENLVMALIITRINYTTIDYSIEMVEFGKASHNQKGQAHLSPTFFYGSESDVSHFTGNSYFSTEFIDERDNNCYTYIRLGMEDGRPDLLAKVKKNCNGKMKEITLENFPTLIEK